MQMTKPSKVVFGELLYGLGIICGNGHELAYKIIRRNDSEALREDWKNIGEYFQNAIGEVDLELGREEQEKRYATGNV